MAQGCLETLATEWNREFATAEFDFAVESDNSRIVLRKRPVLPLVVATREEAEDCLPVSQAVRAAVAYATGRATTFMTATELRRARSATAGY